VARATAVAAGCRHVRRNGENANDYLTIALVDSLTVAVGIVLSIAGRLLETVPTYVWRLMTGTLSATDRYWAVETGPHRRLSVLAMHGAAGLRG
jgi:hypothetical protein